MSSAPDADGGGQTPKVPGLEPIFRYLGDAEVPWQEVKRIATANGSTASVWEKWLAFSAEPTYLSFYARWDPGVVIRRHGHHSPNVIFVISGEMWSGTKHCPAGTHIELPTGAAYGPLVAGPGGTVLFEVMMGDPRGWGDDPQSFQDALAARGATELNDPSIDLPNWVEDERSQWGGG